MELPSMVEHAGDKLVVRSLVSGDPVYQTPLDSSERKKSNHLVTAIMRANVWRTPPTPTVTISAVPIPVSVPLTMAAIPPLLLPNSTQLFQNLISKPLTGCQMEPTGATASASVATTAAVVDELPQCKIRRNYSCSQCAFFTQNPRNHLSHLRDIHGERIVINECKLCLYASRHFQKLVRHMKMVHGCVDDEETSADMSHLRGKRYFNRETRKRRLEESVDGGGGGGGKAIAMSQTQPPSVAMAVAAPTTSAEPTLEQLKYELQLAEQRLINNVEEINRQQEFQQFQRIADKHMNIFSMAFEIQSLAQSRRPTINISSTMDNASMEGFGKLDPAYLSETEVKEVATKETTDRKQSTPSSTHSKITDDQKKKFCCEQCSYSTPIKARFNKHVKYHTMPLIKCYSCDFHTPYKWNLDRHTKNHGVNGHFRCLRCDFSSDIKQSLTIHELNHHFPLSSEGKGKMPINIDTDSTEKESPTDTVVSPPTAAVDIMTQDMATNMEESQDFPSDEENTCNQCLYCKKIVASSNELLNHLQQCPMVQRSGAVNEKLDGEQQQASEDSIEEDLSPGNDLSYCGVETAPGYGEVTEQLSVEEAVPGLAALKKVFKCPHCTFWAATASRFHVHIVGHLNRKPFECSLCAYRSNWRWDITKHIRLKTMRDKSHAGAQVLMNDETGRRNYAKYNRYLTLMKVNGDFPPDGKTMRSGDMTTKEYVFLPYDSMQSESPNDGGDKHKGSDGGQKLTETMLSEDQTTKTDDAMNVEPTNASDNSNDAQEQPTVGVAASAAAQSPLDLTKSKSIEKEYFPAFRCGLCQQTSQWKHVIQRHSRLIHAGTTSIEMLVNNTYQLIKNSSQDKAEEGQETADTSINSNNETPETDSFDSSSSSSKSTRKQTERKCKSVANEAYY